MNVAPLLLTLAEAAARDHALDPVLVKAVVEQESSWNPEAYRYEPAFFEHYIVPLNLKDATEANGRAISWGLMQVLGEVAREVGYSGEFLTSLLTPEIGLEYGCRHLANKLKAAGGDVTKALLLWNGGGAPAYAEQVLARMKNYS